MIACTQQAVPGAYGRKDASGTDCFLQGAMMETTPLRDLPSVDEIVRQPWMQDVIALQGRVLAVRAVQELIAECRRALLAQGDRSHEPGCGAVRVDRANVMERILRMSAPSLRPVINATGVIVHTNLGRAPLSAEALDAVVRAARGYCNLEFDVEQGERGQRGTHIADCAMRLCGAEAACAVNNNAGAVLLCLSALAAGRDVIVSRGELVEIGGSFRIPDIMRQSGARLIEVGTTNCTHARDYRDAITETTALILKVHPSNYRIAGFSAGVGPGELAAIGRERGVPVAYDMGSGCMAGLGIDELGDEPTVQGAIASGVDLVMFSADKLLGGPQAGLIAGRKPLIDVLEKHPLARVLRLDKMTLAALEQTLRIHADAPERLETLPVFRMLKTTPEELRGRARRFVRRLRSTLPGCAVRAVRECSRVGGGACPLRDLPTWAVEIDPGASGALQLERRLRLGRPAVAARIRRDRVLLDMRTVLPTEAGPLLDAVKAALTP